MAMELSYRYSNYKQREIGAIFGVEYSTVSQSRSRLKIKLKSNRKLKNQFNQIQAQINKLSNTKIWSPTVSFTRAPERFANHSGTGNSWADAERDRFARAGTRAFNLWRFLSGSIHEARAPPCHTGRIPPEGRQKMQTSSLFTLLVLIRLKTWSVKPLDKILISFPIKDCQRKAKVQIHGTDMDIFTGRKRLIRNQKRGHWPWWSANQQRTPRVMVIGASRNTLGRPTCKSILLVWKCWPKQKRCSIWFWPVRSTARVYSWSQLKKNDALASGVWFLALRPAHDTFWQRRNK